MLLSKIIKATVKKTKIIPTTMKKLPNRFCQGFQEMGAINRTPRANSTKELISSIKAYAQDSPAVEDFVKNIDSLNPKHLGLAQDVIDLSKTSELLPTNINMNVSKNGTPPILDFILKKFPAVSRKNPEALELAQEVINHSDNTNAKYFLARFFENPIENLAELAPQMKAAKKIVPHIAKDTLSGSYTMDYSKNEEFFQFLTNLLSKDAKSENIELIDEIMKYVNKFFSKLNLTCNLNTIKKADTAKLKENLKVLPQVLENLPQGKSLDVTEFLIKNTNVKAG